MYTLYNLRLLFNACGSIGEEGGSSTGKWLKICLKLNVHTFKKANPIDCIESIIWNEIRTYQTFTTFLFGVFSSFSFHSYSVEVYVNENVKMFIFFFVLFFSGPFLIEIRNRIYKQNVKTIEKDRRILDERSVHCQYLICFITRTSTKYGTTYISCIILVVFAEVCT